MSINWGLAYPQQNALANIGQNVAQGFQLGQMMAAKREREQARNALSAYATNPNEQTFAGLAQAAPEFAMRERYADEQRRAQEAQQRQQQMGTVRQLLAKAGQSPEGWQQAMSAAQSLGIDTSAIPQQYDPAWAQQQLFILDALERDKADLPGLAEEVLMAFPPDRRDPNSAEFRQAYISALEGKYAAEYTDAQGNTRRRSVLGLGNQGQPVVQEGATATNPQTGEKIIFRNGQWQAMGGTVGNNGGGFPSGQ